MGLTNRTSKKLGLAKSQMHQPLSPTSPRKAHISFKAKKNDLQTKIKSNQTSSKDQSNEDHDAFEESAILVPALVILDGKSGKSSQQNRNC